MDKSILRWNTQSDICEICGRKSTFRLDNTIITPQLKAAWGISAELVDAFNRKESMFCSNCGGNLRIRRLAAIILKTWAEISGKQYQSIDKLLDDNGFLNLRIAEINKCASLHDYLKTHPGLYYSEYTANIEQSREDMIRSEDIQKLTYPDDYFDLIITSETLEHVPDIDSAIHEIYRTLKPGGHHIFTVPIIPSQQHTVTRAIYQNDKIQHILSPAYHGRWLDEDMLVFNDFGTDIVDRLNEIGLVTEVYYYHASDESDVAIVFRSQKQKLTLETKSKNMLEWTGERYVPWMSGAEIHYEHLHRYAFVKQFVAGKNVVDLACGEGYGSSMLAEQAAQVIGVDIDEKTVLHATNKYVRDNLKYIRGSITGVPLTDGIFDLAVCFEAIEHISEHDKLLSEVKRLLKKDGIFIVSTPNKSIYTDRPDYHNPYHVKELYYNEFVVLLKKHFNNVKIYGQRVFTGSNMWSIHPQGETAYEEWTLRKSDSELQISDRKQKEPLYYIALASNADFNEAEIIENGWIIDTSDLLVNSLRGQINDLSGIVRARDGQIDRINTELREKDTTIGEFKTALSSRDIHITELKNTLDVSDSQIAELNAAVMARDAVINQIMSGLVIRLMIRLKVFVDKIIPPGTAANRLFQLVVRGLQLIVDEGFGGFWTKFKGWHRRNSLRGLYDGKNGSYLKWLADNELSGDAVLKQAAGAGSFIIRPRISIVMPVWNTDARWLKAAISSVVSQTYDNWELCIADGGSAKKHVKTILDKYSQRDRRIKVKYLPMNGGISANTNEALALATGEYVALMDHDDELAPFALYEVVRLINNDPEADMIYSDEDKIDTAGNRFQPFFKPDWSPDLLNCFMYIGHLTVYKRELVSMCNGLRTEYDLAQDYDLALRASEAAKEIRHIPRVLYHWRAIPGSAAVGDKKVARTANHGAVNSASQRRNYRAAVITADMPFWINRIKYKIDQALPVSIVISSDDVSSTVHCIDSILRKTVYPVFEIICIAGTDSKQKLYHHYYTDARVRIIESELMDYASKCNLGASFATGDCVLFLNENVEAIEPHWLQEMAGLFIRREVGAVGSLILRKDGSVESAGLVTGGRGLMSNAFKGEMQNSDLYFCFIQCTRNVSALSSLCLMVSKDVFLSVGGFDHLNTPIIHAAADLCFRIRQKGYFLVYTPFARVKNLQDITNINESGQISVKEDLYLLRRWPSYIANDPYYTQNISAYLKDDNSDLFRFMPAVNTAEGNGEKGNILLVSHDLSLSGAPILLYNIADFLVKQGYYITVISPVAGPLSDKFTQSGIPIVIDNTILYGAADTTARLLGGYDLVIANTILTWQSVRIAKEKGVATVWMIHESEFGRKMAQEDANIAGTFDMADLVIFSAHYTSDLYAGFSQKNNFEIIYNGLDEPIINGPSIERDESKFYVLHAGSIEPRKGQDILACSILDLPDKIAGVFEFYFAGRILDKKYSLQLHKMLHRLKNVHFLGELKYDELARYFQMVDAFVLSSRDEVLPLTVLQAMAQGKAIITTAVGGIPEIIDDQVDGILIPAEDRQALTAALLRLYNDPDFKRVLEINSRSKFVASFTLNKYGDNLLRTIRQRIEKSRL